MKKSFLFCFSVLLATHLLLASCPTGELKVQAPLRLPRGGEKPSGWYSPPLGEVGRGLLSFKFLIGLTHDVRVKRFVIEWAISGF